MSEIAGRVVVVGAGSVGSTIAYAVMVRGLAGQIVLVDANQAKAEAQAKDLSHGLRYVPPVRVWAGSLAECAEADIVVVTAGARQKPGQDRLDLTRTNVALFRELIPAIGKVAPTTPLLVVSNPVDLLTCVATRLHPGGAGCVFGSGTVLDTSRFATLIAERIGLSVKNVHAFIVGEHGESELPLWSSAHVGAIRLDELKIPGHRDLTGRDRSEIVAKVRSAAAEIIAAKGATNWAIGLATARILQAVLRDENAVLTVSRWLSDYYGISDVCLSVPCVVNRKGAEAVLPIPMNDEEIEGLRASAGVVKWACESARP